MYMLINNNNLFYSLFLHQKGGTPQQHLSITVGLVGQTLNTNNSAANNSFTGFVRVLENLKSHGILFFSFPGLESQGLGLLILCRVMESHGKLNHHKKL